MPIVRADLKIRSTLLTWQSSAIAGADGPERIGDGVACSLLWCL